MKISSNRIDFSKLKNLVEYPDFLDVQLQSYKDFFQLETPPEKRDNEGLFKVFKSISSHIDIAFFKTAFLMSSFIKAPPPKDTDKKDNARQRIK